MRLIESRADLPFIFVCAPAGAGKTTFVRQFVERSNGSAAMVAAAAIASEEALRNQLAASTALSTLVVDDADLLEPSVLDLLFTEAEHRSTPLTLVLTGRRRSKFRVHSFVARGVGALIDERALAFSVQEVHALAAECGVSLDDEGAAELFHRTDGWAIAVAWILREAGTSASDGRSAFEHWRGAHGRLFLDYIDEAYAADRELFAAFSAALSGRPGSAERFAEYEESGFPIVRSRNMATPYRLLSTLRAAPDFVDRRSVARQTFTKPMLVINALGRFRCVLGDTVLDFQRRRDRSVLVYIAVAPEMRVTREQLLAAFWPGADRALATQSLRTTLSRIRRSIGDIVGRAHVDRYLESTAVVRLSPEWVSVDVARFIDHVRCGNLEDARGSHESARTHFSAAERIYKGQLLASEGVEPAFREKMDQLETMYEELLVRAVQMFSAEPESQSASTDVVKLMARSQNPLLHAPMAVAAGAGALPA